jgi:hypothetical protein
MKISYVKVVDALLCLRALEVTTEIIAQIA